MSHDFESLRQHAAGLGATKVAHLDGDLLAHVTNVYTVLKKMGCPEHVMIAGLFHGSYGTTALGGAQTFELSEAERETVRAIVGDRSEQLVYSFCVMTYESLGRSVRNVMRGEPPALRNRCTEQPLPVSPQEFHELLWMKLGDLLVHVPKFSHEERQAAMADYGSFWQIVAQYLGTPAIAAWNDIFANDGLRIPASGSRAALHV